MIQITSKIRTSTGGGYEAAGIDELDRLELDRLELDGTNWLDQR